MDARHERAARAAARRALAADRAAAGRDAPWRRRWRMLRRSLGRRLLDALAPTLLRLLARTWRVECRGEAGLEAMRGDRPKVLALWHGRMLAAMPLGLHRRRDFAVLVSPSDDGALVTRALAAFGYRVVRGSASRGGGRALRELGAVLAQGGTVVVTPDGPRGPRHTTNVGIGWLARDAGAPIVGIAIAVDRAWRLRSWDRFTIPKPFARIVVDYTAPVTVAAGAADTDLERAAAAVATAMRDAERAGFAALHAPDDLGPA